MNATVPTDRHCPPWCAEHHQVDDAGGHAVSHRAAPIDPHVSVSRLVRDRGNVSTTIHLRPDLLTADQARTVAAALLAAADLLDGRERKSPSISTDYSHDDWQRALLRLGASGTLEMLGTAVVVEHDATDDTLRLHAPERTDVERVREVVHAAALALGII